MSRRPEELSCLLDRHQQRCRGPAVVLGLQVGTKEVLKRGADVALAALMDLRFADEDRVSGV